jgi:hypothetical protein
MIIIVAKPVFYGIIGRTIWTDKTARPIERPGMNDLFTPEMGFHMLHILIDKTMDPIAKDAVNKSGCGCRPQNVQTGPIGN